MSTPTKADAAAGISPLTMANAAEVVDKLGDMSPVGAAVGLVPAPRKILPPVWWDPNGPLHQSPPKKIPEMVAETPPKTILPDGFSAVTGSTPPNAHLSNAWLEHRVCNLPHVPGYSFENPFCLETPTRDKPQPNAP